MSGSAWFGMAGQGRQGMVLSGDERIGEEWFGEV